MGHAAFVLPDISAVLTVPSFGSRPLELSGTGCQSNISMSIWLIGFPESEARSLPLSTI
nr:MAG TPA: hypothetical protein [Caudoviricetes sp.]